MRRDAEAPVVAFTGADADTFRQGIIGAIKVNGSITGSVVGAGLNPNDATIGNGNDTVMVNGRVLMRDRKMLTLDEAAVLAEARKFAAVVRAAVRKPASP